MRIIECEQGSEAWLNARAGVITASMFRVARERLKSGKNAGGFTEAAKKYAFRLAVERISGKPLDEGFETWQMRRGHELEPMARARHEEEAGVLVERAGFVTTDDGWFGASADGFIGADGGAEYKCLVSPDSLMPVLLDDDISDYLDQIQGCMWITGRLWWHYGLYCPALESIRCDLYWRPVERDDNHIEAMEPELLEFRALVMRYEAALRRRGPVANEDFMRAAACPPPELRPKADAVASEPDGMRPKRKQTQRVGHHIPHQQPQGEPPWTNPTAPPLPPPTWANF